MQSLVGTEVESSDFRVPRFATADLSGARVLSLVPRGKHMLTRFDHAGRAITLHTHLEMDGEWSIVGHGKLLPRRLMGDARLVLATSGPTAIGLRLPVVELVPTEAEHTVVGHLGPDLLDDTRPALDVIAEATANLERRPTGRWCRRCWTSGWCSAWATSGSTSWRSCAGTCPSPGRPGRGRAAGAAGRARDALRVQPGGPGAGDHRQHRPGERYYVYGRTGEPCRRCGTKLQFSPRSRTSPGCGTPGGARAARPERSAEDRGGRRPQLVQHDPDRGCAAEGRRTAATTRAPTAGPAAG